MTTVTEAVALGANLLDRYWPDPDWAEKIDLERLSMRAGWYDEQIPSRRGCVLAQLHAGLSSGVGSFGEGLYLLFAAAKRQGSPYPSEPNSRQMAEFGFDWQPSMVDYGEEPGYAALVEAWRAEIEKRR